ncbi:M48 family metallopeptidase [Halarchaeum nitratireducens]|uniref:Protease HtpX n=1 Tax=Halarchaeum nitratireducens TaxID=489913 RepID=A0A830G8T3_9EURY|nr:MULTISPECIES: M48 family metalloprotease [Halarchaeum]MBP2249755.1 heat shock protein HtpX [Halarchaeum solikamskense]GGN10761.1 protease HtpX [Halarchaeum nitratireducens]
MKRLGLRLAMAAVGVALLVGYVGAAALAYWVLAVLWTTRPDPTTALTIVAVAVIVVGSLSYAFGTRHLLARLDAEPIARERAPGLYDRAATLCERMDTDVPAFYVGRMAMPNAFALGGIGTGVVVLDRSLFGLLTTTELDAILAHELAHLESHDGFVRTLAFSVGETLTGLLSIVLFPAVLSTTGLAKAWAWFSGRPDTWTQNPVGRVRRVLDGVIGFGLIALTFAVNAHSRHREFAADDRAADVTDDPIALARALRKIERASRPTWAVLSPFYVHSDDDDVENPIERWFSTHPDLDERVERLREKAAASDDTVQVRVE